MPKRMLGWRSLITAVLCIMHTPCCTGEDKIALLVVDVQKCFTQGGSLELNEGDQVIPVINQLRSDFDSRFDLVVLSQDWHCADHVSFASQHPKYSLYDQISLSYLSNESLCSDNVTASYTVNCAGQKTTTIVQSLWPDHCVINTTEAELHQDLTHKATDVILKKGNRCYVDSYSMFYDNGGFDQTPLQSVLEAKYITTLYIIGLATDYCVYWTALDAKRLNYKVYVVLDGTRGVAVSSTEKAIADMKSKGIQLIDSADVQSTLPRVSSAPSNYATGLNLIVILIRILS